MALTGRPYLFPCFPVYLYPRISVIKS